ncbi:hypothetical protein HYH02_015083 [Chlamydomonas schloesseri]|uniref:EF-hand domain-containing protein n=1 Tax=Chlamydomonas schloesseri TaxID=2026947 RepID=A0A835SD11_9CHLO|nr:hypothetical protein HYH02_015083 [Chlamydomonas schloesseri]|eukprot:KAG2425032.1 hypothetical protein HYH02_015083 [Chlamydomonas schloesseri]
MQALERIRSFYGEDLLLNRTGTFQSLKSFSSATKSSAAAGTYAAGLGDGTTAAARAGAGDVVIDPYTLDYDSSSSSGSSSGSSDDGDDCHGREGAEQMATMMKMGHKGGGRGRLQSVGSLTGSVRLLLPRAASAASLASSSFRGSSFQSASSCGKGQRGRSTAGLLPGGGAVGRNPSLSRVPSISVDSKAASRRRRANRAASNYRVSPAVDAARGVSCVAPAAKRVGRGSRSSYGRHQPRQHGLELVGPRRVTEVQEVHGGQEAYARLGLQQPQALLPSRGSAAAAAAAAAASAAPTIAGRTHRQPSRQQPYNSARDARAGAALKPANRHPQSAGRPQPRPPPGSLSARLRPAAVHKRLRRKRGWDFAVQDQEIDFAVGRGRAHVLTQLPAGLVDEAAEDAAAVDWPDDLDWEEWCAEQEEEDEGEGEGEGGQAGRRAAARAQPKPGPTLEAIKAYAAARAPEVIRAERLRRGRRLARATRQQVLVKGRLRGPQRRELGRKIQKLDAREWFASRKHAPPPPPLHPAVRRVVGQWFGLVDVDGGGSLNTAELTAALQASRIAFAAEDVDEMIKLMDVDGDGVINWREFEAFFMYEFAAGKSLLSGDYVLPSGTSLPLGAMISRLRRERLLRDLMRGGSSRAKWRAVAEDPLLLEDELGMMAAVELAMEEMKDPNVSKQRERAAAALQKLPPHLRSAAVARHLAHHPEITEKLLRANTMSAVLMAAGGGGSSTTTTAGGGYAAGAPAAAASMRRPGPGGGMGPPAAGAATPASSAGGLISGWSTAGTSAATSRQPSLSAAATMSRIMSLGGAGFGAGGSGAGGAAAGGRSFGAGSSSFGAAAGSRSRTNAGGGGGKDLNVALALAHGLEWPVEGASLYNRAARKTARQAASGLPRDKAARQAMEAAASAAVERFMTGRRLSRCDPPPLGHGAATSRHGGGGGQAADGTGSGGGMSTAAAAAAAAGGVDGDGADTAAADVRVTAAPSGSSNHHNGSSSLAGGTSSRRGTSSSSDGDAANDAAGDGNSGQPCRHVPAAAAAADGLTPTPAAPAGSTSSRTMVAPMGAVVGPQPPARRGSSLRKLSNISRLAFLRKSHSGASATAVGVGARSYLNARGRRGKGQGVAGGVWGIGWARGVGDDDDGSGDDDSRRHGSSSDGRGQRSDDSEEEVLPWMVNAKRREEEERQEQLRAAQQQQQNGRTGPAVTAAGRVAVASAVSGSISGGGCATSNGSDEDGDEDEDEDGGIWSVSPLLKRWLVQQRQHHQAAERQAAAGDQTVNAGLQGLTAAATAAAAAEVKEDEEEMEEPPAVAAAAAVAVAGRTATATATALAASICDIRGIGAADITAPCMPTGCEAEPPLGAGAPAGGGGGGGGGGGRPRSGLSMISRSSMRHATFALDLMTKGRAGSGDSDESDDSEESGEDGGPSPAAILSAQGAAAAPPHHQHQQGSTSHAPSSISAGRTAAAQPDRSSTTRAMMSARSNSSMRRATFAAQLIGDGEAAEARAAEEEEEEEEEPECFPPPWLEDLPRTPPEVRDTSPPPAGLTNGSGGGGGTGGGRLMAMGMMRSASSTTRRGGILRTASFAIAPPAARGASSDDDSSGDDSGPDGVPLPPAAPGRGGLARSLSSCMRRGGMMMPRTASFANAPSSSSSSSSSGGGGEEEQCGQQQQQQQTGGGVAPASAPPAAVAREAARPLDPEDARQRMEEAALGLSKQQLRRDVHRGFDAGRPATRDFTDALVRIRSAAAALVHTLARRQQQLPQPPQHQGVQQHALQAMATSVHAGDAPRPANLGTGEASGGVPPASSPPPAGSEAPALPYGSSGHYAASAAGLPPQQEASTSSAVLPLHVSGSGTTTAVGPLPTIKGASHLRVAAPTHPHSSHQRRAKAVARSVDAMLAAGLLGRCCMHTAATGPSRSERPGISAACLPERASGAAAGRITCSVSSREVAGGPAAGAVLHGGLLLHGHGRSSDDTSSSKQQQQQEQTRMRALSLQQPDHTGCVTSGGGLSLPQLPGSHHHPHLVGTSRVKAGMHRRRSAPVAAIVVTAAGGRHLPPQHPMLWGREGA